MINEKPDTPNEISKTSDIEQIRQTMKVYSFLRPCLRTKAFCDPIARIRLNPKESPARNPFIIDPQAFCQVVDFVMVQGACT